MRAIFKKIAALMALTLIIGFSTTNAALAWDPFGDPCQNATGNTSVCQTNGSDPISGKDGNGILIKAVDIFSIVTAIVSVFMIMFGGFRYIVSGGDSSKVAAAKNTIIYALIGLVVILVAQSLVRLAIAFIT